MSSNSSSSKQKEEGEKPFEFKDKLSEEDKQLVETLEMLVARLEDGEVELHRAALEALRTQIRDSTSSMTSIPRALKYLGPHRPRLIAAYNRMTVEDEKRFLADIISVLSMTMASAGNNEVLKYCLAGQREPVAGWGHEYVRHLAMELVEEHGKDGSDGEDGEELVKLGMELARFFLDHNGEPEACDLLLEMERLDLLAGLLAETKRDHERVCLYLQSCVPFEAAGDDQTILRVVHQIYRQAENLPMAMTVALRLNERTMIEADFAASSDDPLIQKQLAFMLARQRVALETGDGCLQDILNNTCLTDRFRELAKELDIEAPRTPEDIYKSHLADALRVVGSSGKQNLAGSFVNAFVNAGFCTDSLLTSEAILEDDTKSWTHKTKEAGLLTTVASIGLINLWNADTGLAHLDRYLYATDNKWQRAGALLGIGLVHAGTRNEADPAWALLRPVLEDVEDGDEDAVLNADPTVKSCALMGLALAYGASGRADVAQTLLPLVGQEDPAVSAMAALALGHIFVGTCDGDVTSAILQTLMERPAADLSLPTARFWSLALALLFLGRQSGEADACLLSLPAIEHKLAADTAVLVEACAYAGTGNVLKVQQFLQQCSTGGTKDDEADDGMAYAVLGIGMLSMAEDVGREMSLRLLGQLMQCGSPSVRQAVPLSLALLHTSHPAPHLLDLLSKHSHDADKAVAINATLALGLVAAGTNNAKVAQLLRQLAVYYQKDQDCLWMVRVAQGLVHLGKGTMTVSPMHAHRSLIAPVAMAGLLSLLLTFTDAQHLAMPDRQPHLILFLASALYPRFLITLDDQLKPLPLLVRVGQAVEVVAQAGKPKTITGFQTHSAPVLVATNERAELASEEYLPATPILEGFVLVRKNPDWHE